jgi:hypothetical protein
MNEWLDMAKGFMRDNWKNLPESGRIIDLVAIIAVIIFMALADEVIRVLRRNYP